MSTAQDAEKVVVAALIAPSATLEVVRLHWTTPDDSAILADEDHILDLFLTPRGAREQGRQPSIVCRLRADAIGRWRGSDIQQTDGRVETADVDSPTIRPLLTRLAEEARHPGFASEALTELLTAQLAIELARIYTDLPDRPRGGGLAASRLKLIDDRLAQARAVPTLSELASLCGLSIRQLTRGFRASRGISIGDHLTAVRINHAKSLLAGRNEIKDIADAIGFASPSGFAFAFRRATGETPRRFRQRIAQADR